MNIECWKTGLGMVTLRCIIDFASKVHGGQNGFLDCVGGDPTKARMQSFVIMCVAKHVVLI
jgi:hypothetical protein